MASQISRHIGKCAGLEPLFRVAREVTVHNASERHRRLRTSLRLFYLWVGPQMDLRKRALRPPSRLIRADRLDSPEGHAALFGPEAVLRNPCALAANPDPQAEAAEALIENYRLAPALRQFETLNRCLRQFHGPPWEAVGKQHRGAS